MNGMSTKPEMEFKVGAVRAAVWVNARTGYDGRGFNSHKVIIDRTYKDNDGFKSTGSLDINDIPKAILALKRAYEWILCKEKENERPTQQTTVSYPRRIP